ncbi:extracellular solute-binding protein [Nonomuraea sp. MG754425]|uniref:extracellular solute-binding protein n=1 Tax=Nonomuraea sp. MG754425 TaxID=2570319 RepID=UPI001F486C97|nr:extracellular solute-binding protein [Nonomuraea sp. MG754425]MCF6472476.1 extracellular solute-binding protein [Nonomuraea sp. MG754425]
MSMTTALRRPRTSLIAAATALACGLTLAGCGSDGGAGGGDTLWYSGFGGTYELSVKKALFDPYAAEAGVEVKIDKNGSNVTQLNEIIKSGRQSPDVVDTETATLAQFMSKQMLQPLDKSKLNVTDVADQSLINEFSVPWYQFSRNLYWNTKSFPNGGPTTWAEVWDVSKFPGKRSFPDRPIGTLEVALLASGVPKDKLYPLDVDRAFQWLDKIKADSIFINQADTAIGQGNVVTGLYTLGRLLDLQKGGAAIDYNWAGAPVSVQSLTISKNAANPAKALEVIQRSLSAESQQAILDSLRYTPTVTSVLDKLTPEQRADLPGTEETNKDSFYVDGTWWAQHYDEVVKRWQSWLNA